VNAARKVLVHVGAPKTGTSFVQDLLFQNQQHLAEMGVLYPADRFDAHFLAALDLMELPWGGLEHQAVGAWDRLAEQVRAWEGTVIVSHEILATASKQHVQRAIESFGPDTEVHVIVSVRDLVRQIPAEWQENVKHRRTIAYRDFLDRIMDPAATGTVATWFWGVQDIPEILTRWSTDLPAGNVHVVTVPKPGAPRDLLWHRFAAVFGLDAAELDPSTVERANPSLGVAESAFVRRLNERVNGGVLPNENYRELVRELLAHRTLSRRQDAVRLRLPPDVRTWAVELSEKWVADLSSRGYDLVGDWEDLRPDPGDPTPYVDPDTMTAVEVEDVAMQSLVTLLVRATEMRHELDDVHSRLHHAIAERDQARREVAFTLRARRSLIRRAESNRTLGVLYRAYRKVLRRS
jgi:hypothetical protein